MANLTDRNKSTAEFTAIHEAAPSAAPSAAPAQRSLTQIRESIKQLPVLLNDLVQLVIYATGKQPK